MRSRSDWVDYWAVDFDCMRRKEMIKVPVGTGLGGVATLTGFEGPQGELALPEFEERWTGGYIFENEWQSFLHPSKPRTGTDFRPPHLRTARPLYRGGQGHRHLR